MTAERAVIVRWGRSSEGGAERRIVDWQRAFELLDVPVTLVSARDHRPTWRSSVTGMRNVVQHRSMPEVLACDSAALVAALRRLTPTTVVCITGRTAVPELFREPWHLVLDYVDQLSGSYRGRSKVVTNPGSRVGYASMAMLAGRFEKLHPRPVTAVAAGAADAAALGASWVPISCVSTDTPIKHDQSFDFAFAGTLSYAPNRDALYRLARIWPRVTARRSAASLLVAGRRPDPKVVHLCRRHGWTLQADVADIRATIASARVALAPLRVANGLQLKVLDAAAAGVAQVISADVAAGYGGTFPAIVERSDDELINAMVSLLADSPRRVELVREARSVLAHTYSEATVHRQLAALVACGSVPV